MPASFRRPARPVTPPGRRHARELALVRKPGLVGVAVLEAPRLEPVLEPRDALARRAVGPGLRVDSGAGATLDAVVADRGRGAERLLGIARLEDVPLRGAVAPDARQAVGLELEPD